MTKQSLILSIDVSIYILEQFKEALYGKMPIDKGARNNAIREMRNLRKFVDELEAFYTKEVTA